MLTEKQPNINNFLSINTQVNTFAASEVRETNRIFLKLLSRFNDLPKAQDTTKSGVTKEDKIHLSLVDKKFDAMDSIPFDDPARRLQKMMVAARELVDAEKISEQSSEMDFESQNFNCVKNVNMNSSGVQKKIKKDCKKSSKSRVLARKSTFETSKMVSGDLFGLNGSENSFGYGAHSPVETVDKDPKAQKTVPSPTIEGPEMRNQISESIVQEDGESIFGFSEADNLEDFSGLEKTKDDKKNWDKFGYLFCQSSDSDEFSLDGSQDEFACEFNVGPNLSRTRNATGFQYHKHHWAGNVSPENIGSPENVRDAGSEKDSSHFAGWLERPDSYGPMSLNYDDPGNMSPCLGLDNGCFEDVMEFR